MKEKVRFLGLDVHTETIVVAVAEPAGKVRSLGTIANRAESIHKLVKKLGPVEHLLTCYEAGTTATASPSMFVRTTARSSRPGICGSDWPRPARRPCTSSPALRGRTATASRFTASCGTSF